MPFSGRVPIAPPVLGYLGALTLHATPHAGVEPVDVTEFGPATIAAEVARVPGSLYFNADVNIGGADVDRRPCYGFGERAHFGASPKLLSSHLILGHAAHIPAAGFPATHFLSMMKALPVRFARRTAYVEWESDGRGEAA